MNNFIADFFRWAIDLIYGFVGSYGWTIVIVTIIMRLVVLPLDIKQRKNMRHQQKVQPQLQALQAKYKNDPATLNKKQQELYKAAGVNPLAGCLPMLVQMIILFAFFGAQRTIAYEQIAAMFDWVQAHVSASGVYPPFPMENFEGFLWVKNLWQADTFNIGISQINSGLIPTWRQVMAYEKIAGFNLVEADYIKVMAASIAEYADEGISNGYFILPVLATALSFLQGKLTMGNQPKQEPKKDDQAAPMAGMNMKMFQYMMPIMSLVICTTTSAAYALYWTTTSLIAVISYMIMNKAFKAEDDAAEQIKIEEKSSRKMERKLPKI